MPSNGQQQANTQLAAQLMTAVIGGAGGRGQGQGQGQEAGECQ